ncbi:MAG: twin-arginine translocation signal domain-containing protein [Verrucomicrobia bacterium]|nr:twin-arginine translocation signal domain-containing protein [Verrucomicrobiota bacterium]
MKTTVQQSSNLSGTRRSFLKSAGVLALAAPATLQAQSHPMPPHSEWWHGRGRLGLLAEGVIPNLPVEPAIPWVLPPLIPPPPLPPGLEVRLRATFPLHRARHVLAVQIFVVPPAAPLPLPVAPPLVPESPDDPLTLSYFEVAVTAVELSRHPSPNLALVGHVLVNNPAMFGNVTGASFVLTTGFVLHDDAPVDFAMLGTHVPGNHTTIAPQGKGTLVIR